MSELASTPPREVYMNETDPGIIDQQITEGIALEAATGRALANNLFQHFPGSPTRTSLEAYGVLDQPMVSAANAEQTAKTVVLAEDGTAKRAEDGTVLEIDSGLFSHSDKALQSTWRAFYTDFDQAIAETGIDVTEVARLEARRHETGLADSTAQNLEEAMAEAEAWAVKTRDELRDYILPVYRWLRVHGYSHFDLWT